MDTRTAICSVLAIALCHGCFNPTYPEGLACAVDTQWCPPDMTCMNGTCSPSHLPNSDAMTVDADLQPDAISEPDAGSDCTWNSNYFDPCIIPDPLGDLILNAGTYEYNTDLDTLRAPNGETISVAQTEIFTPSPVRVLSVRSLTVASAATPVSYTHLTLPTTSRV